MEIDLLKLTTDSHPYSDSSEFYLGQSGVTLDPRSGSEAGGRTLARLALIVIVLYRLSKFIDIFLPRPLPSAKTSPKCDAIKTSINETSVMLSKDDGIFIPMVVSLELPGCDGENPAAGS